MRVSELSCGVLLLSLGACSCDPSAVVYEPPVDAGACVACLTSSDCGPSGACVQSSGNDFCGEFCVTECSAGAACVIVTTVEGRPASVCVQTNNACGDIGCGECPTGTACDAVTVTCVPVDVSDAGAVTDAGDVTDAGELIDAGALDAGPTPDAGAPPDAGSKPDAGPPEWVSVDGGEVAHLFFAVVGDTRPAIIDDTANYPTAIINQIYADLEAMNPRPQFVVATGDYMFAKTTGPDAAAQMALYAQARAKFSGPVFAAMGNHECNGYTDSNCATTSTANLTAFMNTLVTPMGKTKPYYSVPFSDVNGQWTAKLIVTACNAWDSAQQSWLTAELARPTTYTFIARHEPTGSTGPCNSTMDSMLSSATYNLLLVGHTHTYYHSGKMLVEGVGGAPISGSANYGYATVEQQTTGGFRVRQYDYQTGQQVSTFTVQ